MTCQDLRPALDALIDGELSPEDASAVRAHMDECATCRAAYDARRSTSQLVRSSLMRYEAPDVLKARIRARLAAERTPATEPAPIRRRTSRRWLFAASLVGVAVVSSAVTREVVGRRDETRLLEEQIVASHIRSLMPGHLTDIASTDQHNVKPWFNGRVAVSPPVVRLDSAGFPLVGGRVDYVDGRPVPVSVYTRRQHVINVYAWPAAANQPHGATGGINGYHLVETTIGGLELWFVSDLNTPELTSFVRRFEDMALRSATGE